jgi:predicted dehydrogenase
MKIKLNSRTLRAIFILIGSVALLGSFPRHAAPQTAAPLRVGMIGLDTSHVLRFLELLNDPSRPDHVPGARVVAAFKGGSPDMEQSATRIERFTAEARDKWKVELVGSIEELCRKVDAVLLLSVDGRVHLEQVKPVFAARKPVFIDKPFTASFRDAREIVRLARESGTPFFSSSSRRFSTEIEALKNNRSFGEVLGAITYGPMPIDRTHPDLFWYGIHSVEALYALMGPGCEIVTRTHTAGADVVTGRWKDGRIGTMRGNREDRNYGAIVFGSKGVMNSKDAVGEARKANDNREARSSYYGGVSAIVKFFQTKVPPVQPEETLEIIAFMEAAEISKARNGNPVSLKEVWEDRGATRR